MWKDDQYFYSSRTLKTIAENYSTIYEGLPLFHQVTNPQSLAEYKADFDMALSAIGKGKWTGITSHKLSDYKDFSRLQRVVIADILGSTEEFIPQIRGYAYHLMADKLNGEPGHGTKTQFKAKL